MVDWLLLGEPRDVQIEALNRSYYGIAVRDRLDDIPFSIDIRPNREPAKGWCHYLEMRLGKTPDTLNEWMLFRRDHGFKRLLVLTPNKFKPDWVLEAEKFGVDTNMHEFNSKRRDDFGRWLNKHQEGLVAVNYEALIYKENMALLKEICDEKTMIVADESITIKGHGNQTTNNALALAKMCGARRCLSGKPISQGPHDLHSQLRFIGEIEGFNYYAFKNAFCRMGGFQGKQILGSRNEERLQAILKPCSWKARKIDWLVTPGKDYLEPRKIDMLPEQAKMYKAMQQDFLVEVSEGVVVAADQIITKLMKLQQISSGFLIDEKGVGHDLMPVQRNPKIQEVKSILANEVTTKVIVFCHYKKSVQNLLEGLAEFNPAIIKGGQDNTVEEKNRFNNDRSCRVLIGVIEATRYGHTLMGNSDDPCHTIIYFENTYSLNDRSQTEERPQGAGQSAPISVIDFVCTSEDLRPIRALQRKEDVAAIVLQYARETGILPVVG